LRPRAPDATVVMMPKGAGGQRGGAGGDGTSLSTVDGILVPGPGGGSDFSKPVAAAGPGASKAAATGAVEGIVLSDGIGGSDASKGGRGSADASAGTVDGVLLDSGSARGDTRSSKGGAKGGSAPSHRPSHADPAKGKHGAYPPDHAADAGARGRGKGAGRPSDPSADGKGGGGKGDRRPSGARPSGAFECRPVHDEYSSSPVMMCMRGCGRPVAPGLTRSGKPFDTCCKGCALGRGHDVHCQRIDPSKVGAGLCKMGCGRPVAKGKDSSGQVLETCCHGCAIGAGHDENCGRDVGDMFVPYVAISGDGFFRDARAVLEPIQFNQLLEHIRLLNRGQEKPDKVIAAVNVLFLPGHPELAKSFKKMVESAPKVKLDAAKGAGKGKRRGKGKGAGKGGHKKKTREAARDGGGEPRERKSKKEEMRAKLEERKSKVGEWVSPHLPWKPSDV